MEASGKNNEIPSASSWQMINPILSTLQILKNQLDGISLMRSISSQKMDPQIASKRGVLPLYYAVAAKQQESAKLLVSHGNAAYLPVIGTKQGNTAMHLVAQHLPTLFDDWMEKYHFPINQF